MKFSKIVWAAIAALLSIAPGVPAFATTKALSDYCVIPPFIAQQIPPQVLINMGKDHKLYYPAYNDSSDIAGSDGGDTLDGILETGYIHAINYYGYFDSNKCYSYSTTSGVFVPFGTTTDKYCTGSNAGKWAGNFLNWVGMSRADIVKMVLYGGYRTSDASTNNYAEISGEFIPTDAHSWGKEYLGSDAASLFPVGVANKRALFCVTGTTANSNQISQLKVIPDASKVTPAPSVALRAWSWVTVDGSSNICQDNLMDLNNDGNADSATLTGLSKYNISVRVCQADGGFMSNDWETKHCKLYGSNGRPVGLMQIYGESGSTAKVCSKDMYTSCTATSTCSGASPSLGECIDKTQMYFGLMMGSYKNPQAGGYLRKNVWSIQNETSQTNGVLSTSDPDSKGLIMKSIEGLKCPTTYPLPTHWGNPIGEILYESMRYWAGLGNPTSAFTSSISAGSTGDNGYYSSMPGWEKPGNDFPSCSIPFNLLFSDSYNSFDDDQLPGSAFSSSGSGNSGSSELTNLNVQTLADTIAANEGLTSGTAMLGQVGTTNGAADLGACTAKTITSLSNVRGICPAEGDMRGTYYPAAVALYGHTKLKANHGVPNVNTFVISFNSVMPELPIYANGKTATIVPYGKSNNGCSDVASYFPSTGYDPNTSTTPSRGLVLAPTGSASTCNTLQTTSFFIMGTPTDDKINPTDSDSPRYDSNGNLTYIKFRWASDDIGGGDYDLDMLEEYEICSGSNNVACKDYNGNTLTMTAGQVAVTVRGVKSAAGNDAALGFIISGTGTTDGAYLPVRKMGAPNGSANGTWTKLPVSRTMVFTLSGNGGKLLKDPLWFTAKYGGFNDMDGDGLPFTDSTCDPDTRGTSPRNPKCNEWDTQGNGDPDNYFLISNPRQVETQVRAALDQILSRTASGTAASILSNSQGSGANILQALFYPKKLYPSGTQVTWTGELQNLWYFVDPFINDSSIREDSDYTTADPLPSPNPAHYLDRSVDKKIQFFFDTATNQTKARRFTNDGSFEEVIPDDPQKGVMSLWNAGKLLWTRDPTTRTVYTTTDGSTLYPFLDTNAATLKSYLQAAGSTSALQTTDGQRIIDYTLGTDVCLDTSLPCTNLSRSRTATITLRDGTTGTHVWKLGDIVSSTPRIQGNQALGLYDLKPPLGYNDATYSAFTSSSYYKNRGMVYVGANDGMLHAFKFGLLTVNGNAATLSGQGLGVEQWAYIPRQTLPYLKYLMDPAYKDNHVYMVDGTTSLFDVSTASSLSAYWNDTRTASSWKTLLVGSTGLGGASAINSSGCVDSSSSGTCVKTPTLDPSDASNATGLGYSSYFALDVTNQDFNTDPTNALRGQPTLKWEFSDPALGYATSGPAMVRINAKVTSGTHHNHDTTKNGRWLAVFASGPTGPIDSTTHRFMGTSNQNLKLFVVDIEKGPTAKWVIDTGIPNAYAGNISGSVIDTERATMSEGYYQDDAFYVGYTKKASDGTWTEGGVLRVVIPHDNDPDNLDLGNSIVPGGSGSFDPTKHWVISKLVEGTGSNNVGPVTTAVAKLQGASLYLFFGSGRYAYSQDDMTSQRRLYMVKDNCYKPVVTHPDATKTTVMDIDDNASPVCQTTLGLSDLTNRTDGSNIANDTDVTNGWYINLGTGERVVTDTVATVNGAVYYTTFVPTGDICSFGGTTYFWGVKYNTGFQLPANSKQGQVLIQVSTGSFEQVDIASTLTGSNGRRSAYGLTGKASGDAPPVISKAGLDPLKRILHIQERRK